MTETLGLSTTLNGLETMAKNSTGYRELLCILETVIELESWFGNDELIYNRCQDIQDLIIPEITHKPRYLLDKTPWAVTKEIQAQHGHMTVYAAEAVTEYWLDNQ